MKNLDKRLYLASRYLLRKTDCNMPPLRMGVELTNNCNLECIMCPRGGMSRKIGNMDIAAFKRVIDQGKQGLEMVSLQDAGESTLNPGLAEMIRYCKKNGVRTLLSTNATLLRGKLAEDLVSSGLDYIIFALDGATKETYEKIRIGADYDAVVSNIKNFITEKKRRNVRLFCTLQCIYMDDTEKEIRQFVRMWNIPGVDAVRIRQITHGVDTGDPKQNKYSNIDYKLPCYWLWSDPYVKWDGTVVPCCQDVNADYVLGNIIDKPMSEIWNCQKMQDLRNMHLKGGIGLVPLCKNCNMYKPKWPFILGSSFVGIMQLQKLVPFIESVICKRRYS